MIELETALFLQNQKTGSTFVEKFLRANSAEHIIVHKQHRAPAVKRKGKFYFTTVRDPLDLYLSLFNYGLDGGGMVRYRLDKVGLGQFYEHGIDGFDAWLAFVLSPAFKPVMPLFEPHCDQMGLCAWRYQQIATINFRRKKSMLDHVLRFETLNDDLKALARADLAHCWRDVDEACEWIDSRSQINASNRRDRNQNLILSRDTLKALLARERLLYDQFYADRRRAIKRTLFWPRFGRPITLADLAD